MTQEQLIAAMTGRWSGPETITMDPAAGTSLAATGRFDAEPVLAGAGLRSSYSQDMSDAVGMQCETVYRFGPDGAVTMVWIPLNGSVQTFHGTQDGAVLTLSRTDGDGMIQTQIADYSTADRLISRMVISIPNGPDTTVFEGHYERQPISDARPTWHDLTIAEPDRNLAFYEAVFGGKPVPVSMGDYSDYNLTNGSGETLGGLCHARGGNADLPPVWLTYFPVPSLDAALAEAKAEGGTIISGPHKAGDMRYAVLSDPSGASFALSEG